MAGEAVDRSEFEGYIRRHEADENAHSAERHRQNNDWAGLFLRVQTDIGEMEKRMNAHDVAHANASGELRGVLSTIRIGFVTMGLLLTAFGGTVLYVVTK